MNSNITDSLNQLKGTDTESEVMTADITIQTIIKLTFPGRRYSRFPWPSANYSFIPQKQYQQANAANLVHTEGYDSEKSCLLWYSSRLSTIMWHNWCKLRTSFRQNKNRRPSLCQWIYYEYIINQIMAMRGESAQTELPLKTTYR